MEDIASLTLKIDSLQAQLAKKDLDNLSKAGSDCGKTAELLQGAFGKLMAVLGPAALIHALYENVKSVIELQSQYVRLAEIAGTTASIMSSFDLPARLAGTSLDTVASSIARLSKSIGEARLGDVSKQGLLKALGIDITDGRDAAEYFIDIGKSLTGMKDQTVASASSMQLLGRGFAEMKPLMKEIVEQGGLHARVTNEEAEAAKKLEDEYIKLTFQMEQNKFELTKGLLPALQDIADAFKSTKGEASGFEAVGELIGTVLKGIVTVALSAATAISATGTAIGAVGAAAAQVAQGNFKIALDIMKQADDDIVRKFAENDQKLYDLWNKRADTAAAAARKTFSLTDVASNAVGRSGAAGGDTSAAEARIKQLLYDQKHYEERINLLKAAAIQYADAIKLAGQLADEAFRQAGEDNVGTQTALLQRQAALNRQNLEQQIKFLQQQRALSQQQGNVAKVGEATGAIAQLNAQIVANEAITQAKIQTLRAETGRKMQDEYGTQAEIENRAYALKLKALEAYFAAEGEMVANAAALRQKLETDHQAKLGDVSAQGVQQRMQFDESTTLQQASFLTDFFTSTTSAAAQHNRKMFELNKIAGEAQIIVSTTIGAMKAWELGPILGPIMAAVVVAAGAANLAALEGTTFGGGGSIPRGGSSGGSFAAVFPPAGSGPPAGAPTQASGGSQVVVNVNVSGNMVGNQDFVDNTLLPAIRDAVDNRDFQIIGPNSRQAANLQA